MRFCPDCGKNIFHLDTGGCGGEGAWSGCEGCGTVFQQTNGGIVAPSGGTQHSRVPNLTLKEAIWKKAQSIRLHKVDWEKSEDFGKWRWSEVGFGPSHLFDTPEEAHKSLDAYVKKCETEVTKDYPVCPDCGEPATKWIAMFNCKPCKRYYSKSSKEWIPKNEK